MSAIYYNKDLEQNKTMFAKARQISDQVWIDYLENAYPDWWAALYKDKWPVNIVYYSDNIIQGIAHSTQYPLYVHKNSTMREIMMLFKKQLQNQCAAVRMCFGDMSELILQHLPCVNDFNPDDTYIYVHRHVNKGQYISSYCRLIVPNDRKLIHLCGDLREQDTSCLNLRIRRVPLNPDGKNFKEQKY